MQLEVHPPFPGPVAPGQPGIAPKAGIATILGTLTLAAVGIGFGAAAVATRRGHGRLVCVCTEPGDKGVCADPAHIPVLGVPSSYHGDADHWWDERGRRLYWKARRTGASTATGITGEIIAAEIGRDSPCMAQFPPHEGTREENSGLWDNLVRHVQGEMAAERAAS